MAVGDPHTHTIRVGAVTVVVHYTELAGHGPWNSQFVLEQVDTSGVADVTVEARDGAGALIWASDIMNVSATVPDIWTVDPATKPSLEGADFGLVVTPRADTAGAGGETRPIPERPI